MFLSFKLLIKKILSKKAQSILIKILLFAIYSRNRAILFLLNSNSFFKSITQIFTARTFESRDFENIHNYAESEPHHIRFLYNNSELLYYSSPIFDFSELKNSCLSEVKGHVNYAAILNEATVIGRSSLVLLRKGKALYDLTQYNSQKKYKYSDEAIETYKNNYCLVKINNSGLTFDEAIFLGGNYSWNYYHLVYEILARFERIDAMKLNINIPFIVDDIFFKIPQFKELFELINDKGRKVISLDKGKRYLVKQLYYFSCPNFIPPNFTNERDVQPEDILFDLSTLSYLRSKLLPCAIKKDFPTRIFISRSNSKNKKRTFNEDKVFETLQKHGFEVVFPENYSITDQISLFNNADVVVGGTGAAFTSLLFCKESCKVIIFAKNKLPFSGFSTIARYFNIKLLYFTDELSCVDDMKSIHDSYTINTDKLNTFLSEWI